MYLPKLLTSAYLIGNELMQRFYFDNSSLNDQKKKNLRLRDLMQEILKLVT